MHKRPTVRVIAMGGGGFTHDCDPTLDDFVLSRTGCSRPRIGLLATASHDDTEKIRRFHARFAARCERHVHLLSSADAPALATWLNTLDAVYVAGGNTVHLLAHWRQHGWDQVLLAAARRGVLMAGVSAGASVWFEQAMSDAGGNGLAPLSGLGLVKGSCCPHYSQEPHRQPAFATCIARGDLPDGVAIDDGVAVLFENSVARAAFSARPAAGAYHLRRHQQQVVQEPIAPFR
jgi:peptidase E